MNTTRDVVAPAMRAAAEDLCGSDADKIFTSDTRDLLAFFVTLRRLLREVGHCQFCHCRATTNGIHSVVFTTSLSRTSISPPTAVLSRYFPT